MKVASLKDLKKLLQLCREQGVHSIKLDGMEFGLLPTAPVKAGKRIADLINNTETTEESIRIPQYTPIVTDGSPDTITTPDELTEEQLMMWSSQGAGRNETV